ncbi:hypothetical protein N7450_011632 [Penicillium hetheringtonii]|uniref:Uncharacterized protein n=1 Tax=Penicillium hetheringtonii TaxID=911720 RepID=A0AAD6DAK9_9EURO|nr:hypothetical protein N7450_011632 [Penicillium hetheringtonii]
MPFTPLKGLAVEHCVSPLQSSSGGNFFRVRVVTHMYHLAGGGAYYFAKQSINAERDARYEAELNRKYQLKAIETEHRRQTQLNATAPNSNGGAKPNYREPW